jgi:enamine deaminase RidA (YjgF/YER057c/UK114 family)
VKIINPTSLGAPRGFSHGVLAPLGARLLFVAGQTAADADGVVSSLDFAAQFDTALARVLTVVQEAGGSPSHVVRMTVFVSDLDAYLASRQVLRDVWARRMGTHYPAMVLVEVNRLVDKGASVEIEAIAAIPDLTDNRTR